MTDVVTDSLKYILFLHKGQVLKVDRQYVEGRAAFLQAFNDAGKWLVDKPRSV
jgi:hypothetical protein